MFRMQIEEKTKTKTTHKHKYLKKKGGKSIPQWPMLSKKLYCWALVTEKKELKSASKEKHDAIV